MSEPTIAGMPQPCSVTALRVSVGDPDTSFASLIHDADGFNLRPDPLGAQAPAELVAMLRTYWTWAGQPSFRQLARRSNGVAAASTFCMMLRSEKLPPFSRMLAFVQACGGSEEDQRRFATAWRCISLSEGPHQEFIMEVPGTAAPRSQE
jgi:hypothetical protein